MSYLVQLCRVDDIYNMTGNNYFCIYFDDI